MGASFDRSGRISKIEICPLVPRVRGRRYHVIPTSRGPRANVEKFSVVVRNRARHDAGRTAPGRSSTRLVASANWRTQMSAREVRLREMDGRSEHILESDEATWSERRHQCEWKDSSRWLVARRDNPSTMPSRAGSTGTRDLPIAEHEYRPCRRWVPRTSANLSRFVGWDNDCCHDPIAKGKKLGYNAIHESG